MCVLQAIREGLEVSFLAAIIAASIAAFMLYQNTTDTVTYPYHAHLQIVRASPRLQNGLERYQNM